jgi:hypothetical protein
MHGKPSEEKERKNLSLVNVSSPSPNFCSFSRDASKSGLGGTGAMIYPAYF